MVGDVEIGLPVNLTHPQEEITIFRKICNEFFGIDVRGSAIKEEKLGRWKSPLNMRNELGVGCGLVKASISTSPIMCGGGGGL